MRLLRWAADRVAEPGTSRRVGVAALVALLDWPDIDPREVGLIRRIAMAAEDLVDNRTEEVLGHE